MCPWGKCPGGTCPGGFCPVTVQIIMLHVLLCLWLLHIGYMDEGCIVTDMPHVTSILLCSLNQDKLYNFVFSSFIGPLIITNMLDPCWHRIYLLSAHTGTTTLFTCCCCSTVWCVPATSPFLRRHVYFVCLI